MLDEDQTGRSFETSSFKGVRKGVSCCCAVPSVDSLSVHGSSSNTVRNCFDKQPLIG